MCSPCARHKGRLESNYGHAAGARGQRVGGFQAETGVRVNDRLPRINNWLGQVMSRLGQAIHQLVPGPGTADRKDAKGRPPHSACGFQNGGTNRRRLHTNRRSSPSETACGGRQRGRQ